MGCEAAPGKKGSFHAYSNEGLKVMFEMRKIHAILILALFTSVTVITINSLQVGVTVKTQRTAIIFQETEFEYEENNTIFETNDETSFSDIKEMTAVLELKGYVVITKFVHRNEFNSIKVIQQYGKISTELFLVFYVHGEKIFGGYFLSLNRLRLSSAIVRAIGDTQTSIYIASCFGGRFIVNSLENSGISNIRCLALTNESAPSWNVFSISNDFISGVIVSDFIKFVRIFRYLGFQNASRSFIFNDKIGSKDSVFWSLETGVLGKEGEISHA